MLFQDGLELLQDINTMLLKVNEIQLKKVENAYSIPTNIALILLKAFKHCQTR